MTKSLGSKLFIVLLLFMMVTVVACSNNNAGTPVENSKEAPKGKFVFWDKSEYVKEYNEKMKERVVQFGKDNNVEVEYVIIAPNDLKTKLLASIEAKNTPDLIVTDDFLAKQFTAMEQLVDVSDVLDKVPFLDTALNYVTTEAGHYLVPQAFILSGVYLRKDKWEEKGLDMPKTWKDLSDDAKIVNDPDNGFYATGIPMGASGGGDAEGMVRDIILGFGGSVVDKDNKVVVNSPETLEAITFIASLYKDKLTPPSSVTWDDMGNNNAYAAGTVGFAINSGSIYSALKEENPELLAKTVLLSKLGGPEGVKILGSGNVFAIFKNGKNTEAAKQFVTEFYEMDFYTSLVESIGGMWGPVIEGGDQTPFWQDPNNATKGWLEQTKHIVGSGNYPGPEDDLGATARSMQLGTKTVQRIVVEGMDPQKSLDQLEKELKELYGQ
jgi:multiple sugar transport system substrate-binding protein